MKIFGTHFLAVFAGPFQVVSKFRLAFFLFSLVTKPFLDRPEILG
jgi:hypothetical protein